MSIGYLIGYQTRQLWFLFIIGINQFLLALILYLRSNISALLLFKVDSMLSVLDRLFMILICSVLLWGNIPNFRFTIKWFIYAQTLAYCLTALIAFFIVINKTVNLKLNWNPAFFSMVIKKSWPYAVLVFLMSMYSRIDSFLIERILPDGAVQAGIYASAFRLFDVANNMSGVLFAALLLPIFSKMIKQKKDLNQMIKLPFTLLFIVSVGMAIAATFYGENIMNYLYHPYAEESASQYLARTQLSTKVLVILMFTYIATSFTYIFGTLLTANGSLSKLNKVAFVGVIISLVLNFWLIPKYSSPGSAWAALSAQWITALLQIYLAFKLLKIKFESSYLMRLFIFIILTIISAFFSNYINVQWHWQLAIMAILVIFVALVLKLLNLRLFFSILKTEE